MFLKPLVIAGAVVFATSVFAQQSTQNPPSNQQQPQTPANGKTNAQGEQPAPDRTMQEKDTGLMNQSGGAPGATGSTGTQSGTTPNAGGTGTKK
ncbi:MAG: hypothetical protein V7604_1048 [Hyphomicrobiales bacterium]|jgi:hypothetical protein